MSKVKRTRNAETLTEAGYFGMLRSGLRRTFRYWKPAMNTKNAAKKAYKGKNKRQKWVYRCAECKKYHKGTEVQVDHIVPCGSLRSMDDVVGFIERLTAETGYQLLCKACHVIKTNEEKKK